MRPGILFTSIFTWLVFTGGRFTAPFLHTIANFSDSLIGITIAVQYLLGSVLGSVASLTADKLEREYPGKGHVGCLIVCLVIGTIAFQLHYVVNSVFCHSAAATTADIYIDDLMDNFNNGNRNSSAVYDSVVNDGNSNDNSTETICDNHGTFISLHLLLRFIYGICQSIMFPILDGATLAYLKLNNRDETEYGKERLNGAIAWAVASIVVGPILDRYGFDSFFIIAPFGSFISIIILFAYMNDLTIQPIFSTINTTKSHHHLDKNVELIVVPSNETQNSSSSLSEVYTFDSPTSEESDYNSSDEIENLSFSETIQLTNSDNTETSLEPLTLRSNNSADENNELFSPRVNHDSQNTDDYNNSRFHKSPLLTALFLTMIGSCTGIGFLTSAFTLSMGTSVVENLIFLFFQTLGSSYTMCGVTVVITVLFEIPIFHYAPFIVRYLGPEHLQTLACFGYITRVLGYTFVPKDHMIYVIFLEPLHGLTYAFSKMSSVEFASRLSQDGFEASSQGLISLVLGMGSVLGLCFGGWIEGVFGPKVLYRSYAVIVFLGLIIFVFTIILDRRKMKLFDETKNCPGIK